MNHLDARTIRGQLNAISLAIATLDQTATGARHHQIAAMARDALEDISELVTQDEIEEYRNGSVGQRDGGPPAKSGVSST